MEMYSNFSGFTADEERGFIVYEQAAKAREKSAFNVGAAAGGAIFLFAMVVYFGFHDSVAAKAKLDAIGRSGAADTSVSAPTSP